MSRSRGWSVRPSHPSSSPPSGASLSSLAPVADVSSLPPSLLLLMGLMKRESFTRNLPKTATKVSCLEGTFSAFPAEVEDRSADAVAVAQAFHWVSIAPFQSSVPPDSQRAAS